MDWIAENDSDRKMLKQYDLSLLDVIPVDNPSINKLIDEHNTEIMNLKKSFQQLAVDRNSWVYSKHWITIDYNKAIAERQRILSISCEVLVELQQLLSVRQSLLAEVSDYVVKTINQLEMQKKDDLINARRTIEQKYRIFLQSNPNYATDDIIKLAEEDDKVVDIQRRIDLLESIWSRYHSISQKMVCNTPMIIRQLEFFEHLGRSTNLDSAMGD